MTVPTGTPVTSDQAARAVLGLIRSPVLGPDKEHENPGQKIQRIRVHDYHQLSGGEQKLVDIAHSVWNGHEASISLLGGLDFTTRRRVLVILWYYFLGTEWGAEVDEIEYGELLGRWA